MTKEQVVTTLKNMAKLLELMDENFFKIRAFINAAKTLEHMEEDFYKLVADNELRSIPGIGKGIEGTIMEIYTTGTSQDYEELQKSIPISLLELYRIPGLGSKRIRLLYQELEITNIGELEYACEENRLINIPGFGRKSQTKIQEEIQILKTYRKVFLYPQALEAANTLLEKLLRIGLKAKITGDLRRKLEVTEKIQIIISDSTPSKLLASGNLPLIDSKLVGSQISGETEAGIPVTVHFSQKDNWGTKLVYTTGSQKHLDYLYFHSGKTSLPLCTTEAKLYEKLGLAYFPPELREGLFEPDFEKASDISDALVSLEDIKGVFHVHSNYSDGIPTLEEIAALGEKLGYQYIGIADHSQSAFYANGLKPETLIRQMEEIDQINQENGNCKLLKGLEVDILPDGSLDCSDQLLEKLNYVVVSVHSNFKMTEANMTKRIIRALSHPLVSMLGHPTGRLLLTRQPYAVDLGQIIEVCSKHGVAIEINANPMRLDLDWRWARKAYLAGVSLVINPDAHRLSGFTHLEYGVNIARKAGLPKGAILNTKDLIKLDL